MSGSARKETVAPVGALTDGWMERQAAEAGLVPDAADDLTLQLDLDDDASYLRMKSGLALLASLGASHPPAAVLVPTAVVHDDIFWDVRVEPSKSGEPHRHVRIKLARPLPVADRVALQAILGSDPSRELLSLAGAWAGKAKPVVLFRVPDARVAVGATREDEDGWRIVASRTWDAADRAWYYVVQDKHGGEVYYREDEMAGSWEVR